ncbi:F0F1 ATP synthase subunit B [Hutsoniella sourekii]|uniref:F0F1 ATP synthase subunit B n=1 Tax=Hutsoniella sourekii TaxID=87650 RepID=UPI0004829C15|nr:F0F1 ATP synthase subunit B [Hutsoniella sourekii]
MEILGQTALGQFLMTLIAFGLVIFLVYKYGWQPITQMLEERKETITRDLKEAQMSKDEVAASVNQAHEGLVQARKEAQDIIDAATKTANNKAQLIEEEARQRAEELEASTRVALEQERAQMQSEMEESVLSLSIAMAEKILRRELSQADQEEYVAHFISQLQSEVNPHD